MRNHALRLSAAVLASLWLAANASASDAPMLDTFSVDVGVFANNLDAGLRVNGNTGRNTTVDLKRDLGVGGSRSLPFFAMTLASVRAARVRRDLLSGRRLAHANRIA